MTPEAAKLWLEAYRAKHEDETDEETNAWINA
jgi:hypothetical protein